MPCSPPLVGPRGTSPALSPLVAPLGCLLLACAPTPAAPGGGSGFRTEAQDLRLRVDRRETARVCQLVGDRDIVSGQPTASLSGERFGVDGTDSGFSLAHEGELIFLFGDTVTSPSRELAPAGKGFGERNDAMATARLSAVQPGFCPRLTFESARASGGGRIFEPPEVSGGFVTQAGFAIPQSGLSVDGRLYVFFSSKIAAHTPLSLPVLQGRPPQIGGGKSVLTRRRADGVFEVLYDLSVYDYQGEVYPDTRPGFVGVFPLRVSSAELPGLPLPGEGVLIFGFGFYRFSPLYLAYIHLDDLARSRPGPSATSRVPARAFYLAGRDLSGGPVWREDWENHGRYAAPLFSCFDLWGRPADHLSGVSVIRDPTSGLYYMLYSTLSPAHDYTDSFHEGSQVHFRYGATPWDWSELQLLLDSRDAYGAFIHRKGADDGLRLVPLDHHRRAGPLLHPIHPRALHRGADARRPAAGGLKAGGRVWPPPRGRRQGWLPAGQVR